MDAEQLIEKAVQKMGTLDAVRRELDLKHGNLNNIRKGVRPMPAWIAGRLAEIAGENALEAVIQSQRVTAKSESEKGLWDRLLMQTARGLTIAVVAGLAMFSTPRTSYAFEHIDRVGNIHYESF